MLCCFENHSKKYEASVGFVEIKWAQKSNLPTLQGRPLRFLLTLVRCGHRPLQIVPFHKHYIGLFIQK